VGAGKDVRKFNNSDLRVRGTDTEGAWLVAGIEKPTTEEVGSELLEEGEEEEELRRSDAQDFLVVAGAGVGEGVSTTTGCWCWGGITASVEATAVSGSVVSASTVSMGFTKVSEPKVVTKGSTANEVVAESVTGTSVCDGGMAVESFAGVPTTDTEVREETGDAGTVGVSSDSVAADDGTVEFAWDEQPLGASKDILTVSPSAEPAGVTRDRMGERGGDRGGVLISKAC
jgi:hypothetical protein